MTASCSLTFVSAKLSERFGCVQIKWVFDKLSVKSNGEAPAKITMLWPNVSTIRNSVLAKD